MSLSPAHPKVYHITHVSNLRPIVADGVLRSDAAIDANGGPAQLIGMSTIKNRRLHDIRVTTHPDTKVGDYVP